MFYTALAPLLPHFASRYGLSKGGAGVLSAMYAAGVLAASVPGGMAATRFGPKRGAVATVAGVRPTFIGVGALGFVLWACVAASPGTPAQPQRLAALRRADTRLLGALWLVVLPAFLFGVMDVLAPLHLHAR